MEMTASEKIALVERMTGNGVVWDDENWPDTLKVMNLVYHYLYQTTVPDINRAILALSYPIVAQGQPTSYPEVNYEKRPGQR